MDEQQPQSTTTSESAGTPTQAATATPSVLDAPPDKLERAGFKDLLAMMVWLVLGAALVVGLFAAAHFLHLPKLGRH